MSNRTMIAAVAVSMLTILVASSGSGQESDTACCTTMNPSTSVGTPVMEEIIVTAKRTTSGVIRLPVGPPSVDKPDLSRPLIDPSSTRQQNQPHYNVGVCTRIIGTTYPREVSWGGVTLPVNSLAANQLKINKTRHQDVIVIEQPPRELPRPDAYGHYPQSEAQAVLAAMYPQGRPKIIVTAQGPVEVPGQWSIKPTGGYVPGEIRTASPTPGADSCNTRDVTERYYRAVTARISAAQARAPDYHLFDFNCQHWALDVCWRT